MTSTTTLSGVAGSKLVASTSLAADWANCNRAGVFTNSRGRALLVLAGAAGAGMIDAILVGLTSMIWAVSANWAVIGVATVAI